MELIGQVIWVIGLVGWYIIRFPFERRAKRVQVVGRTRTATELAGLAIAGAGLMAIPLLWVVTGWPHRADYPAQLWSVVLGAVAFAAALWVFRATHKELGKNWSITLEIRDAHKLVDSGLYGYVRHPMYTSFLLMAVAQALLLSNWVAGLSGLVGFAIFYGLRVGKEERMMLETFGPEYRDYMARTKRIIPFLY